MFFLMVNIVNNFVKAIDDKVTCQICQRDTIIETPLLLPTNFILKRLVTSAAAAANSGMDYVVDNKQRCSMLNNKRKKKKRKKEKKKEKE